VLASKQISLFFSFQNNEFLGFRPQTLCEKKGSATLPNLAITLPDLTLASDT